MASVVYNAFKKNLLNGSIDLDTDTIYMALVTSTHTPDQDADEDMADIDNEIEGTGYTAGGKTVGTVTVTQDDTNNRGVIDFDPVTWTSSSITARAGILYKYTGTAATDLLIAYIDFGEDKTSSNGDFTVTPHADGVLYIG